MNWMGLVDDALGIDDLDDEEPYNPASAGFKDLNKGMDKLAIDDQKPTRTKLLSDQEVLTDLGESPSHINHKISSGMLMRYDPHEPHSAQPQSAAIRQPVSGNLMNFKDDSLSPDGSPAKIETIPESTELDILGDLDDDSLGCNENSYEEPAKLDFGQDECDLVDDDFFQNLMKKPEADDTDISEYLNNK